MMKVVSGSSRDILRSFNKNKTWDEVISQISIPLGVCDDGTIFESVGEVPAMLVTGTTGSGKSSVIKTLIAEIMLHHDPHEVRFFICDSSRIEYACFDGSPYLGAPVFREATQLDSLIQWIAAETERRLALFSRQPVKDYPHLFLVLDDFVALELSEEAITLLEWILQKARLVKVHVILVTSLPSSRSLSSGILSNTDYRIAFRVTSKADSIRAIGRAGANELATPGEMIVRNGSDIVRCKAAYMADDDLRRLCMEAAERYEDEVGDYFPIWDTASNHAAKKNGNTIDGALIDEAARIVVENRIGSTSALQRKLKVGYAMASRIMDELEARGVVGPPNGSKPREVIVDAL
jgi:S-DNA-T family DNA segregation ATPase FtsK/SpoIIIE